MSLKILGPKNISDIEAIVRESITIKNKRHNVAKTLNIVGNVFDILIYQILTPIITSICANSIYDNYKQGKIDTLSIKKSKEIIKKCTNETAKDKLVLSEELRTDMERILKEYDNKPEVIDCLVNKINEYLQR